MKKPLLFSFALLSGFVLSAQTIIFEDNFDSYTAGMGVVEQNSTDWSYWANATDTDGMVDDAYAASGANSVLIDGTGTDLVLPIGPYNGAGKYDVKFKMMIEEGAGGYFNLLHNWAGNTATYEWAVDVFFSGTGEVTWTVGASATGAAQVTPGEWFDIQVTADLDNDEGHLYLNGEWLDSWQWSLDNADGTAGLNQIAALDLYGTNTANGAGTYWVDDVQVINSTGVGIGEAKTTAEIPGFYPNPAASEITLVNTSDWKGGFVQIFDLTGNLVHYQMINDNSMQRSVDISKLVAGVYMVRFSHLNKEFTRKLVVRD